MQVSRSEHTATRLSTGEVLIVGGFSGSQALKETELFVVEPSCGSALGMAGAAGCDSGDNGGGAAGSTNASEAGNASTSEGGGGGNEDTSQGGKQEQPVGTGGQPEEAGGRGGQPNEPPSVGGDAEPGTCGPAGGDGDCSFAPMARRSSALASLFGIAAGLLVRWRRRAVL